MRCIRVAVRTSAAVAVLTLASASHAVVIPLGNLFDDAAGTPLATAIATDTYQATADAGDLGVDQHLGIGASKGTYFALNSGGSVSFVYGPASGVDLYGGPNCCGYSNGSAPGNDSVDGASNLGLQVTETAGGPSGEADEGIGIVANHILTFDLDELRLAAGLATDATGTFSSDVFGVNDSGFNTGQLHLVAIVSSATGVLSAYINGDAHAFVEVSPGQWAFDGSTPSLMFGSEIDWLVPLGADAKFLTIGTVMANGFPWGDHGAFINAELELVPEPSSALLFGCGLILLGVRRRRAR